MTEELDTRLRKYLDAVRYRLFKEPIRSFFTGIPGLGRRLLAIQRYVSALRDPAQGQAWIDGRWAMTEDEFQEWRASSEGVLRNHELRGIVARFNADNSGFRLVAGSQFRSLNTQRDKWNVHSIVGMHAATLLARARREIGDAGRYPDLGPYLLESSGLLTHLAAPVGSMPGIPAGALVQTLRGLPGTSDTAIAAAVSHADRDSGIEHFVQWLAIRRAWAPTITIATPGLSSHGVGQAIDFQIHKSGVGKILGADSPRRWHESGWAARLAAAVRSSRHFFGPLEAPDEPWHWTFDATP
jgi:hypothetical protein